MSPSVPPSQDPSQRGFATVLRDRFRGGRNASRDRAGDARFVREDAPPATPATPTTHAAAAAPVAPVAHEHGGSTAAAPTAAPVAAGRPVRRTRSIAAARGSRSVGGGGVSFGRRFGGLLLTLLLTIALAALIAVAIASFLGSDDDDGGSASRDTAAQRDGNGAGAGGGGQAAVRPGMLGVGGRPVATGATLTPFVGRQVQARGMEVVQVDGRSGFFVGGGKGERTFVEWGPRAGGDEATRLPSVGDRVDITGPIAEPPRQPGRTLGVPVASERVILKQGGYVNADTVTPAR